MPPALRIAVPNAWHVPPGTASLDDPLLGCLQILCRIHARDVAPDSLTAGLPLIEHRLTPDLFTRAAERGGLGSKIVHRTIEKLSELVLPAVLLLEDKKACVLVRKSGNIKATIVLPETGQGEHEVTLKHLAQMYTGYAILARPRFQFDDRTAESTMPRTRHWFWSALSGSWRIYGEVLIASFLVNLFALAMPLFTMNVYDRVVPSRAIETLWVLAIGVGIVLMFDLGMRALRGYFVDLAGKKIDVVLSTQIHERVLGLQMAARPKSVGAFASSVQEFEAVREFITSVTITTIIDLPFALLFIAVIAWIAGPLAWICVAAVPVVILASLAVQRPLGRAVEANIRLNAQRQASLIETLVGLDTIKIMRAEGQRQRRWEQVIAQIATHALKSRFLSATAVNFSLFMQQLAYLAIVIGGVYLIAADKLTVGALIACTLLTGRALAPLAQIAGLLTRYKQTRTSLGSIDRLMNLPIERPADKVFLHRQRLNGAIEFRGVSFSYPDSQRDALENVSFKIAAGERVALIGRIGSGKSTIEKLILGLYPPKSGSILIDGTEVRQLDPAALRRNIGHVPQDITLFYGSVRDNILIGAPYAEESAMARAAEIAGVSEFIDRTPNGFDLPVGERGESLSGGQRQAIAIARAELLAPPILLFDEPTSAMDAGSEEQFKARLQMQLSGRTLLLVTHRPSLLSLVNRLIVMDGGRVVADGPKDKVLQALAEGKVHVAKR